MIEYTLTDFNKDIAILVDVIKESNKDYYGMYGIPQGGVPLALALSAALSIPIVDVEELADFKDQGLNILIVDDLIDSGKTIQNFAGYDVAVLGVKPYVAISSEISFYGARTFPADWVHFWWEPTSDIDAHSMVTRLLEFIGEDPTREGLKETPARVVRSFDRLYGGYKQDPAKIMKTFSEDDCDEMVILKDITLHSTCEHHMLPFSGVAHIGYIPDGRVLGVSKLARLLDIFARRLQIQERIGEQVTAALMEHLKPLGAACVIEARHSCMTARGVEQQTSLMVTSSLKGVYKDKPAARAEFMQLIKA